MSRLPNPGSDDGTWGDILNDYLSQSLDASGLLKTDSVGSAQLQSDAVNASSIEDGSITEALLDSGVQAKLNQTAPVTSVAGKTGAVTLVKTDVGLANVDNTSDANKPVSTATQTALDGKENVISAGSTSQYYRGDKTFQTLDKSAVGLGSVDNTSDATKNSAAATLSNKRIQPRVVTLTDGATITPDGDTTDIGTVTLGGNRTMAAPAGTPLEGQSLILRIKQDGAGSRTLVWDAAYRFPSGVAPTLTTTLNKTDYIGFKYNAADAKWDCLAERLNI